MTQLVWKSAISLGANVSDTEPVPGGKASAFMNDSVLAAPMRVTTSNGEVLSIQNMQPGQIIELEITHVHATFTGADDVIIFS